MPWDGMGLENMQRRMLLCFFNTDDNLMCKILRLVIAAMWYNWVRRICAFPVKHKLLEDYENFGNLFPKLSMPKKMFTMPIRRIEKKREGNEAECPKQPNNNSHSYKRDGI